MKEHKLKNGSILTVREPKKNDATELLAYVKTVSQETEFLMNSPEDLPSSVKEEKKFIKKMTETDNNFCLVGLIDGKIVGVTTFLGEQRVRAKHAGMFGISVLKDYWGIGIGGILTGDLLEMLRNSRIVRKINLEVDTRNKPAISLYKKFNFKKEGEMTRRILINGEFTNAYLMGLAID